MAEANDTQAPAQGAATLTDEQRAKEIADHEAAIEALKPKPKTLSDMGDDELHTAFYDEIVKLLGHPPVLEPLWLEIKSRLTKKAPPAK